MNEHMICYPTRCFVPYPDGMWLFLLGVGALGGLILALIIFGGAALIRRWRP